MSTNQSIKNPNVSTLGAVNNLNMLYLQQLPGHLITKAIKASFIDEPIWQMRDAVEVIKAIKQTQFAITNVYVYTHSKTVCQ